MDKEKYETIIAWTLGTAAALVALSAMLAMSTALIAIAITIIRATLNW